jgi:hypothetical protein
MLDRIGFKWGYHDATRDIAIAFQEDFELLNHTFKRIYGHTFKRQRRFHLQKDRIRRQHC